MLTVDLDFGLPAIPLKQKDHFLDALKVGSLVSATAQWAEFECGDGTRLIRHNGLTESRYFAVQNNLDFDERVAFAKGVLATMVPEYTEQAWEPISKHLGQSEIDWLPTAVERVGFQKLALLLTETISNLNAAANSSHTATAQSSASDNGGLADSSAPAFRYFDLETTLKLTKLARRETDLKFTPVEIATAFGINIEEAKKVFELARPQKPGRARQQQMEADFIEGWVRKIGKRWKMILEEWSNANPGDESVTTPGKIRDIHERYYGRRRRDFRKKRGGNHRR